MFEHLKLNNFPSGHILSQDLKENAFIMQTCQRTLVLTYENQSSTQLDITQVSATTELYGEKAYTYLLEVICGLQSKLLGENEIVSQFKTAYKTYIAQPKKSNQLLLILEKLFQDAKKIRSDYLLGLSQKTYASIARRAIHQHQPEKVLILGSGQLAEDLVNQFKKKTQVFISARNETKLSEIKNLHGVETIDWKNFEHYAQFGFIANSIGCGKNKFILQDFFDLWFKHNQYKRLFVDLGSPSVIETDYQLEDGVMRLEDVFNEGAIKEEHKLAQVAKARVAMGELSKHRNNILKNKFKR